MRENQGGADTGESAHTFPNYLVSSWVETGVSLVQLSILVAMGLGCAVAVVRDRSAGG